MSNNSVISNDVKCIEFYTHETEINTALVSDTDSS